jgi:hydroxymethylglutaryl-CoA reductase
MPRLSTHIHPAAAQIAAETVLAITPKLNALEASAHDDHSAMIAYQNPFAWEEKALVLTLTTEASPPPVP